MEPSVVGRLADINLLATLQMIKVGFKNILAYTVPLVGTSLFSEW